MLAEDQTWEGPGSIMNKMHFFAIKLPFRARSRGPVGGIDTVRHVDSTGINRLAVRLQTLHFMKSIFLKNQKLKKVKSRY